MNRMILAKLLRVLLVACGAGVVLVVVVGGGSVAEALLHGTDGPIQIELLPFVGTALAAIGLGLARPRVDRLVERVTRHRDVTPYAVLAQASGRLRTGSLDDALPGLAEVLAAGTGAARSVVWLAVGDRLVGAARYPDRDEPDEVLPPAAVENLAVLLARPDTDYVVPVVDGTTLRAVLAIGKPGAPITPADQRLMRDVANGAGLLLRGVALNAELADRVRRADELAGQLQASRQRLAQAGEVERRRLLMELSHVTGHRLAALRSAVSAARRRLDARPEDAASAQVVLARARTGLDDLLDGFRVIARGVYPAVLRDQGPTAALDEVAADLPRAVRITGGLPGRLAWEIESGIYYAAASAVQELAGHQADDELVVHLEQVDGRVVVLVEDPSPPVPAEQLRVALTDDVERLAALGGGLELTAGPPRAAGPAGGTDARGAGPVTVRAWLPDRLEPLVESSVAAELKVR
ncbi:MAG: hypothetical protein QOF00_1005 [Pseudonocardiales bacterium]|jgi:signal transduction histidine kinase|nr:hypothetical protein [Pseudonocardiales bacterium]